MHALINLYMKHVSAILTVESPNGRKHKQYVTLLSDFKAITIFDLRESKAV